MGKAIKKLLGGSTKLTTATITDAPDVADVDAATLQSTEDTDKNAERDVRARAKRRYGVNKTITANSGATTRQTLG